MFSARGFRFLDAKHVAFWGLLASIATVVSVTISLIIYLVPARERQTDPAVNGSPTYRPTVVSSPSISDTHPETAGTSGAGATSLAALPPVLTGAQNFSAGSVQIGTRTFPESVRFTCQGSNFTYVAYDVAGFMFLDVTIGVPRGATNGTGNTATVAFFKDGKDALLRSPVTVVVGQPVVIHLDLKKATQLVIGCNATINASHDGTFMDVALADALLVPTS